MIFWFEVLRANRFSCLSFIASDCESVCIVVAWLWARALNGCTVFESSYLIFPGIDSLMPANLGFDCDASLVDTSSPCLSISTLLRQDDRNRRCNSCKQRNNFSIQIPLYPEDWFNCQSISLRFLLVRVQQWIALIVCKALLVRLWICRSLSGTFVSNSNDPGII